MIFNYLLFIRLLREKKKLREERGTEALKGLSSSFPFFLGGGGEFKSRFIWLNGSITLIRAETERYDIVLFSKVTTKSLASVLGKGLLRVKRIR